MSIFFACVSFLISQMASFWALIISNWILSLAVLFIIFDWVITLIVNSRSQQ